MASFQKSQDIDVLSVRKIFAKGDNNTTIPANSLLATDGQGGTSWISMSTIQAGVTFNTFVTTPSTFTSGPQSSQFSILDGDNAGLIPGPSGNSVKLYSKSFGEITVSGQSSIKAFNTFTGIIQPNVSMAGTGIINISTDTSKNLLNFYSPNDATSSMSTVVGNFVGLNGSLSNTIASFNSPFSTFIYAAISSFSTSLGTRTTPTEVYSTISSFSTAIGPVISTGQVFSAISSFSTALYPNIMSPTQVNSTFSSFSTLLGPVISTGQVFSAISSFSTALYPNIMSPTQVNSTFSSFSTTLFPQINTSISSFSTALGTSLGTIVTPNFLRITVSSFSTALGPVTSPTQVNSAISSFSTSLGPLTSPTQIASTLSSFSTAMGPLTSPTQVASSLSSFSTALGPVIQISQVNTAISSFSTILGTSQAIQLTTRALNTSTINLSGSRQPAIQYGSNVLTNGSTIVTLSSPYNVSTFNVQLTYLRGTTVPIVPLSVSTMTTSNFLALGDPDANFSWTTYGNLF